MGRSEPTEAAARTGAVEFLDSDVDAAQPTIDRVAAGGRWRRTVAVAAAAVTICVVGMVALGQTTADDAAAPEASVEESTATDPNGAAAGDPNPPAYGSGEYQRDNRYSEIRSATEAVWVAGFLGNPDTQPPYLIGLASELAFPPAGSRALEQMSFDASGNFFAGSYTNEFNLDVLVVGRVSETDWQPEPVGVGVNGFAWHPSEPGLLGFAKPDPLDPNRTDVSFQDYTQQRIDTMRTEVDLPGRLRLFGDWGAAFDEPGPSPRTSVYLVDQQGAEDIALEGIPGTAIGMLGNRLLIDGPDGTTLVNTRTSVFEDNQWIEPEDRVVSMKGSPDGKFAVALVVDRNSRPDAGGRVLLLADDPQTVGSATEFLFGTTGPTAFDWTPDGRFVAGFQPVQLSDDGQRVSAASVTVYDLNKALFSGRELRFDGNEPDTRFQVGALAFRENLGP